MTLEALALNTQTSDLSLKNLSSQISDACQTLVHWKTANYRHKTVKVVSVQNLSPRQHLQKTHLKSLHQNGLASNSDLLMKLLEWEREPLKTSTILRLTLVCSLILQE
jgi:hypothetical protein